METGLMHDCEIESTMNEFIQMAASNLGLSEDSARSATDGLLQWIQKQVDGQDADQLMQQLHGSQKLLEKASKGTSIRGLRRLASKINAIFGGNIDATAGLIGVLSKAGLSVEKFGPFASIFVDFLKKNADIDLVGRVLDRLPDLKKITI